jgi:fluoroacetyl-CoA thioesterase
MKPTLQPGLTHRHTFTVSAEKTVPRLYPESRDFATMPAVFATGFMVGLMEWACIELLAPHLDPGEISLGVSIDVDHAAATVPGQVVTVEATLVAVEGRRLRFAMVAHDGIDRIGSGAHGRAVVTRERFVAGVNAKAAQAGAPGIA